MYYGEIRESDEAFFFLTHQPPDEFSFLWAIEPGRSMPYEHEHVFQSETFEVLHGTLTLTTRKGTQHLQAGQSACIAPRTFHVPHNDSPTKALVCRVTLRPAFRAATTIRRLCALSAARRLKADGRLRWIDKARLWMAAPENFTFS